MTDLEPECGHRPTHLFTATDADGVALDVFAWAGAPFFSLSICPPGEDPADSLAVVVLPYPALRAMWVQMGEWMMANTADESEFTEYARVACATPNCGFVGTAHPSGPCPGCGEGDSFIPDPSFDG